jgi:cyclophilin family peptidyl-prolyl cis-trans isomerase
MRRALLLGVALGLVFGTGCVDEKVARDKDAREAKAPGKNPVVVMKTSKGTIKIELFQDKAPITVKNFLGYVHDKFYDGTIFHRVIGKEYARPPKDFMIQGGGFKEGLSKASSAAEIRSYEKETKAPIKNEARASKLSNERGTLAMARTNDPDSATAQFFINIADNKFLDADDDSPGYAVFGKVIEGMDVVDKIKAVKTKALIRGFTDVPVEDVVIESVRRADK